MKKILILLFLFLYSYAVELLEYSVYDRSDRVDIMLSFDGIYEPNVKKSYDKNKNLIELTFKNIKYNKEKIQNLNSSFLEKFKINSKNNDLIIMFKTKEEVNIDVSNNNKFGIRIRITPQQYGLNSTQKEKIPALKEYDYTNYIYVMAVLIALVIVLFILKRKVLLKNNSNLDNFDIIFQRPIDRSNQFVILEYNKKQYAMIIGNSNIVLEKHDMPTTIKKDDSFDSFFEENKRKIQNLINKKNQ